jgi:LacI family transcriptional regulator
MIPHVLLVFEPRFEAAMEMLNGIVRYQREHAPWQITLYDSAHPEVDPSCWVRSRKWDGVISAQAAPSLAQTCAKLSVPLVDLSDTPTQPGASKIRPNNHQVGQMAAAYLIDRRFRYFGFCGFSNHPWSAERQAGFIDGLGRARQRCDVFDVDFPDDLTPMWEAKQINLLAVWLRCLPAGTAVMACNDLRAQQVVRAAGAAELRVPDHVGVLGANNDVLRCELADLPLSSVAINAVEAGYRAAEHLGARMADPSLTNCDLRIEPSGVVTRKSTDLIGLHDENVAIALSYIREHACRGITVDEVLQNVTISRSNLEHKLRRYLGWSPQVEIRRVQVAKICQLLTETNLSLKEIADRTGFVHVEYMCVLFKRLKNMTPGHYRNQNVQSLERPFMLAAG